MARNSAFEHLNSGILVLDTAGRVVDCNPTARRILSQSENTVIGVPITEAWPDSPEYVRGHAGDAAQSGSLTLRHNGDRRFYDVAVSPVYDGRNTLVGQLILFHDSTERERADAERRTLEVKALAQSKLATLGQLATGVAHEVNQPLAYISMMIQGRREDFELKDVDEEAVVPRLDTAIAQVERIIRIVRHLRTFGRSDNIEMAPVNLETILDDTMMLLGEHLRLTNIAVERQVEESIPRVLGSANQLEQVFINLFQNSTDSFPLDQRDAKISVDVSSVAPKDAVQITFSDNGSGIAPGHLDRIFEPFFTTKAVGEGTGLGLSIVYGIIQDHSGTITCESEYTGGTKFVITLPTEGA